DDRSGEPRLLPQLPHAVAHVLEQIAGGTHARRALLLLPVVAAQPRAHRIEVAQPLQRPPPRLLRRETRGEVLLLPHLEVEAQLVLDVRVGIRAPEPQVAAPARRLSHRRPPQPIAGSARSTRVTASA